MQNAPNGHAPRTEQHNRKKVSVCVAYYLQGGAHSATAAAAARAAFARVSGTLAATAAFVSTRAGAADRLGGHVVCVGTA